MKKEIFNHIEIPEGVEANIDGNLLKVKGKEGNVERRFNINNLVFEKRDKKIVIGHKNSTKKEKKITNTITAHIKNMFKGIQEKFDYKLKIASSHFPISVELKENKATVKNFLGEKIPREVEILDGAEVKIDNDIITIKSINKELAGQTAANFEKATRIRMKDRRVFQDGIFIINKAGKEI